MSITATVAGCSSERDAPGGITPSTASGYSASSGGSTSQPSTAESLAEQQAAAGWSPDACPSLPAGVSSGYAVGDQLAELVLKDCEGNTVDIREVCGAGAVWLSFAHGWCPHCRENASNMERVHQSWTDRGANLASVNVVVQDNDFDSPTESICVAWRTQYEQNRVLTLYDPLETSAILWDDNFTALNVVLDGSRVITTKVYTDIEEEIESAIASAVE